MRGGGGRGKAAHQTGAHSGPGVTSSARFSLDGRAQKAFETQVSPHPRCRLCCADGSPMRITGFLEGHPDHWQGMEAGKSGEPLRTVNQGREHRVVLRVAPSVALSSTGTRDLFFKEMSDTARTTKKTCSKARPGPRLSVPKALSPHSLECVYCRWV